MKRQLLNQIIFILLLVPVYVSAQPGSSTGQDITGMWKGALFNDTTQKFLTYELAISEEKGKLTGYSYTIFDIDGKKEIGVKRIKIKRKNDQLIIEDIVLISNNYSAPPPRGVRQMSVVDLSFTDTAMLLKGRWSTNPTSIYRPLTGSMKLERAPDFKPVALYKKLEELHLEKDLSFVKTPATPPADIVIAKPPVEEKPIPLPVAVPVAIESAEIIPFIPKKVSPVTATTLPPQKVSKSTGAVINTATITNKTKYIVITKPVYKPEPVAIVTPAQKSPDVAITGSIKKEAETPKPTAAPATKAPAVVKVDEKPKIIAPAAVIATAKPKPQATEPVKNTPVKQTPVPVAVAVIKEPVKTVSKKPEPVAPPIKTDIVKVDTPQKKEAPVVARVSSAPAAEKVAERKMTTVQSVFYQSDSLILTLYDNGDVDGDTVSVLMNGRIIFSRQGLTTKANSKTIYTNIAATDSIMLVMYAENLGSIPPNTGLLMVQDGEAVYYVRFSADLQNNAAILLSRKKNE